MSTHPAIDACLQDVTALRHQLHTIPERGYEEFKTADAIRGELQRLGIDYVDGVPDAPTATIAWIGDTSKPCIALRADIDALPILERTGLPYASTHPGMMHACGHDGHVAILLGAARVLAGMADALPVCVKLVWQPAEEGGGGAARLVKAGVLDGRVGPKVQAIFGLHGWPGLPVGCVSTKPGALLAAVDRFTVEFVGRGSHGAFPHLGADPIVAACEAVLNMQQAVSREVDPTEPAVVTVGKIHAGTAVNIIPDTATIEATVRTLDPWMRPFMQSVLQRRCESIAEACGCSARFEWIEGYPPTVNEPRMTEFVSTVARTAIGADRFIPAARASMGGEDFAYYLEKVPGCFFMVGVSPPGRPSYPPLHSDQYDFTDAALETGMRMFVELATHADQALAGAV